MSGIERGAARLGGGLLVLVVLAAGCSPRSASPPISGASAAGERPVDVKALRPQVTAFCGDCHAVPPPSSFVKDDWAKEVRRGFELYWATGRTDLEEPRMHEVIAYYESQAPESLTFEASPPKQPFAVRFRRQDLPLPPGLTSPAVSNFLWQPPEGGAPGKLLMADMRHGQVARLRFGEELSHKPVASLGHPASVDAADLDADGETDYLVADLGSFLPEDHDRGRVVWLKLDEKAGWTSHVLLEQVGRVAQAVDGDFDGDGDSDVLVAEFGWLSTGKIRLLRRRGDEAGLPSFESEVLDPRHGASFVLPIDWEQDGDLDFVALITQEHEKVELFVNDGSGAFAVETIYAAGDPAFGSSGIELTDLDQDGDMDVLYTNGDAMDSMLPKPYHAVRWLENEGSLPFREHLLAKMPNVYKAVSADFDGDGDLDVAAIALPGQHAKPASDPPARTESASPSKIMILLEQTEPGQFSRHAMTPPAIDGLSLVAGDFDADGDADLASGAFHLAAPAWVSLWWNKGTGPGAAAATGK